jgi:hypothetical protein
VSDLEQQARIRDFVRALLSNWGSRITGIASIPATILSLAFSGPILRITFGATAVLCFLWAAYSVWAKERKRNMQFQQRSRRPQISITASSLRVEPDSATSADVLLHAVVHNETPGQETTVLDYKLRLTIGRQVFESSGFRHHINSVVTGSDVVSPFNQKPYMACLKRGHPVDGWAVFSFSELPEWPVAGGKDGGEMSFDVSGIEAIEFVVVDAFQVEHSSGRLNLFPEKGEVVRKPAIASVEVRPSRWLDWHRSNRW